MRTLEARMRDAERARGVLDVEQRMVDEAKRMALAVETESDKRLAAKSAAEKAELAACAHEAETARTGEIDDLRREVDALERMRGSSRDRPL